MAGKQHINVLALLKREQTRDHLDQVAPEMNGHRIEAVVGDAGSLGNKRAPDIVLMELDGTSDDDLRQLSAVRNTRFPGCPVIVTAATLGVREVRALLKDGVADVLPQPFEAADAMAAIEQAVRGAAKPSAARGPKGGRIVSFLKGGGGCGATTIAVQTACALAHPPKGNAKSTHRVALMDLDIQFGTAALSLDSEPASDVTTLLKAPERLDASLLTGVMESHKTGLDLLAAPRDLLPLETVTADFVKDLMAQARSVYPVTLVELPQAWTEWTTTALDESDVIVVVGQMTVPSIRQMRHQIDALRREGLDDGRIRVLVNRFAPSWTSRGRVKQAESGLGRPIDHFVPSDFKLVSEAADQGVALRDVARRSAVEKAIDRFAQSLKADAVDTRTEPRLSA